MFEKTIGQLIKQIYFYRIRQIAILLICCISSVSKICAAREYLEFDNIYLNADASVINCFLQDKQGVIWMGSDKGLFSYNGFSVQQHLFSSLENKNPANSMINCMVLVNSKQIYIGSDNGIQIYNLETDQFEKTPVVFPTDIRSLSIVGNNLWLGSLNGLYQFNLKTHQLKNASSIHNTTIPHRTIYSLLKSQQNKLYIGTYNGLCVLDSRRELFKNIELPILSYKNTLLVNSLLEDTGQNCIWIGTEGFLFKLNPKTNHVERIGDFDGNSIKSLARDLENNLLIGTDNGLYVYNNEKKTVQHILHDSRYEKSLTNNIIWNIYIDKEQNVWLGTDYGVSLFKNNRTYRDVRISQITGIGDGNQLQSIFKDSRNNFWYGGKNGLIFTSSDGKNCIWYKMGDPQHPISHSRIRCIYEDREQNLWVATDGSINRYNYKNHQFTHYNIVDSSKTRNANWAYNLFEDKNGKLWIATCLGGIFVVDKEKLIQSTTSNFIAEKNYYKSSETSGLSDNFINHVLNDLQGNIWALTYNSGINKINIKTGEILRFPASTTNKSSNWNASCMICDHEGYIWVGIFGGLNRIDPKTNHIQTIHNDGFRNSNIRVLTEENNNIWITTSEGTFVLDKKTLKIRYVKIANKLFSCSYYDAGHNEIYFGEVDGFVVFSPSIIHENLANPPLVLTSLYVNDRLFQQGINYTGKSIRYTKTINLNYNQNNITFNFSDLSYSHEEDNKYVYKLKGSDLEWRTIKPNTNKITYTNLGWGSYTLIIGRLDPELNKAIPSLSFTVIIHPPWYYTLWAKLLYFLFFLGLLIFVINYFRDKHRMKIDRIEKKKSLELSNLKIDFFTDISHEFKTPLSLILGPVSKLLVDTKNAPLKKQLNQIQQNALRLNALIQQVIGFGRFDTTMNTNLIFSQVEFIEFAKGIFSVYEEAFQTKKIKVSFITETESLLVNIDVLKIESILNNLISNALKFSREGGEIILTLNLSKTNQSELIISISDTGIGIPQDDLPYVSNRFFQSRKTANDKEGSGIGLYLVKNYVELHQGSINITSQEELGTEIIIRLPVVQHQQNQDAIDNKTTSNDIPPIDKAKALVLIVEDNIEISEFIQQSLTDTYQCSIAHNGKTGLKMALKNIPDLIIADVMMPVMDGIEMCRLLRKEKETMLVPIVMLTAKDDQSTEKKSLEIGINAFMSKPFEINMLQLRIKQLILNKQQMEEKLRIEALVNPKEIEAESWDERILTDITKIIEDNVGDPDFNVNILCEKSNISSKQIYRKIKQLAGLTPVDYIRSIRMKKAAMLLSQKRFSVAEVMYLVGFSNHSYFSKCFTATYGKTPKQYME